MVLKWNDFCPSHFPGNIWQLCGGIVHWLLLGRGQGCCEPFPHSQAVSSAIINMTNAKVRNPIIGDFKYFKLTPWLISTKEIKSIGSSLMGMNN